MRLLFVCSGNVCRSPIAEGLMTAWAAQAGLAKHVDVRSAGTRAPVGREMDALSAAALIRIGGEPPREPSKALTPVLAAGADLVLTMTRRHRRTVLEQSPRQLRRTFTVLEAANLLRHADLSRLHGVPIAERAQELGSTLHGARVIRVPTDQDDVEDPIGQNAVVHNRIAQTIVEGLRPLAEALFSPPSSMTGRSNGWATATHGG